MISHGCVIWYSKIQIDLSEQVLLTQRLIAQDRRRVGQIQAARLRAHGDTQAVVGIALTQPLGQERFDARTEPHAHLHCAQCGRVIDVPLPGAPEPQLCTLAQSVTDAQVLGCSITFTGLCKACQQAAKEAASK